MKVYKSILQSNTERCIKCGSGSFLEWHHVMGGANKKSSEKYGLMVRLCHNCHNEPPDGVHHNAEKMRELRAEAQREFEKTHTREEFMRIFGRNYETD